MIELFGWEAMTIAERFAAIGAIGGAAGLLSVVVNVISARQNQENTKKQLQIAAEANATARVAVEGQREANEVTKRSVDDQLEMNRLAKSAAVRIAEVGFCDGATAKQNGDLDAIPWFYEGTPPPVDYPVMTVTLINEGMGSAYNLKLTPDAVEGITLSSHHNFGWRMMKEGQSFHDALEPYASLPVKTFLSIPPGNTEEFKVAVRFEAFRMGWKGPMIAATYKLTYQDGIGTHEKCFQFGSYLASGRRSPHGAIEIPCSKPENG